MGEAAQDKHPDDRLRALTTALERGALQNVWKMLNNLHPAEIAQLLESLPPTERDLVWELVSPENGGEVLVHVNEELRTRLISGMGPEELLAATEGMDMDDLADLIGDLPDAVIREVVRSMDKQNRRRLESVLSYPDDSAGGLMNTDTVTVRADVTLDVVLRYLRLRGDIPDLTDSLVVVNRFDKYLGMLSLSRLLTSDPNLTVAEVMDRQVEPLDANLSASEVARIFERLDLISAPVVDTERRLLGRITIDDVVDVIREEADHSLLSMAGLDEDKDMFAPVFTSARRRTVWLGVNLVTAFLAAWIIGQFQEVIEKLVALAVVMPIAASMGGVAGTQTLTIMIRGLALGQVGPTNARWLMVRELLVGCLNGLLWAVIVGLIATAWFQDPMIGLFVGMALIVNLVVAALAGFAIPLILHRIGADPALAGGVMLIAVTDVVGYLAFLGTATAVLM